MKFECETIGIIHTPFTELRNMPIQPIVGKGIEGEVVVNPELVAGLKDLDMFSLIYLLWHLHAAGKSHLEVIPYLDGEKRGVFATRAPARPTGIGLSLVRLLTVDGNRLKICDVDMLDGTPLLDIKPYVPKFDDRPDATTGWLSASHTEIMEKRSDSRFA